MLSTENENFAMHRNDGQSMAEGENDMAKEIIGIEEATELKKAIEEYASSYSEHSAEETDESWLRKQFLGQIKGIDEQEASSTAKELLQGIADFDERLASVEEAARKGIGKEEWLAELLRVLPSGMSEAEHEKLLQDLGGILYQRSIDIDGELVASADGNIDFPEEAISADSTITVPNEIGELTKFIGKSAGVLGLQSSAITTGLGVAQKLFDGKHAETIELVKTSLETGNMKPLKVVAAGALQSAVKNGALRCLTKNIPSEAVAGIACNGVEGLNTVYKVASGELSVTQGIDRMGRVTVATICGIPKVMQTVGTTVGAMIPFVGPVVGGTIGNILGRLAGPKIGEKIYEGAKKLAKTAKNMATAAVKGLKKVGAAICDGATSCVKGFFSLFS